MAAGIGVVRREHDLAGALLKLRGSTVGGLLAVRGMVVLMLRVLLAVILILVSHRRLLRFLSLLTPLCRHMDMPHTRHTYRLSILVPMTVQYRPNKRGRPCLVPSTITIQATDSRRFMDSPLFTSQHTYRRRRILRTRSSL